MTMPDFSNPLFFFGMGLLVRDFIRSFSDHKPSTVEIAMPFFCLLQLRQPSISASPDLNLIPPAPHGAVFILPAP